MTDEPGFRRETMETVEKLAVGDVLATGVLPCTDCGECHEYRVTETTADGTVRRSSWAADDGHAYRRVNAEEYVAALQEAYQRCFDERAGFAAALRYCEEGWPDAREVARAALTAEEPHLTVPKRPPTGTTYVTHEPESSGAGELFPSAPVHPAPDDVGPPAPGEGDDLPNPEVGMVC